mmetsp:Transcript_28571/g.57504  ORF Transcript_28571/g.57504 Transcript_28571/m.57504 type:complete len:294 (-) Transcript_28571:143-1024(-)
MAPSMPNFSNFHPQQLRDAWQPQGTSTAMLASWALSCLLALIIPVAKWATERNSYYAYQGKYNEYEQQQRQYEEEQQAAEEGNYYYGATQCQWWNFRCRSSMNDNNYQQYGNNGQEQDERYYEQMQMRASMPSWFFFFGGKLEEDDRQREEMGLTQSQGNMQFVYWWTVLIFIGLAVFGWMTLYKGQDRMGLIIALAIFCQFALLNLITTVGAISTDNRDFEESTYGWYGQFSVLLAYTDFWMMLQTFGFAAVLGITRHMDKKKAASQDEEEIQMGYQGATDEASASAGGAVV